MSHRSDTFIVPLLSADYRDGQYSDSDGVEKREENDAQDVDHHPPSGLPWPALPGVTSCKTLDGPHFKPDRPNRGNSFVVIAFIVIGGIALAVAGADQIGHRISDLHQAIAGLARIGSASHDTGTGVAQAKEGLDWQPHESLTRMVEALTAEEVATREWILSTRTLSQSGTPVGLSQSSPVPASIREGPAMLRAGTGPGYCKNGSALKWESLHGEWQTGRQESKCRNRSWMADYATLHHEILTGDRAPKILEVICQKGAICGGTSDRLFGLFSLFLYAVLTDRALRITWEDLPFELFYDVVRIDWAQPHMPNSRRSIHPGLPTLEKHFLNIIIPERLEMIARPRSNMEHLLAVTLLKEKRDDPPWLQGTDQSDLLNRGAAINSFNYHAVEPALRERGFDPTTVYACMTDFLFRPKLNALRFITAYDSLFSIPTVFSITIQIRTGDKSMFDHSKNTINTVERHRNFFDCADKIVERYVRHDQKVVYYLVTDSRTLKEDALLNFSDRVVVTGLTQAHPELHHEMTDEEKTRLLEDGTTNAQVENWIIGKTDFQIITELSGFGKLPVFMKGVEGATVSLSRAGSHSSSFKQTGRDCASLDSWLPPGKLGG
ncbi:BQ2448_5881 [Microbotryum intermedium]|uniref:BQ2448_5881 protein n=1 Tax=Microbotryum intermedium TaxID=269621 RepID=A0A238F2K5_9BASI|nr:BQ2448_5881 [Microbotryum intermedium]